MAEPEAGGKPSTIEFYGGYQVYSESGIDLTLLRANLARSLEERWENNRRAAVFARALQDAGRPGRPAVDSRRGPMIEALEVTQLLVSGHVEFVVVGGFAMRAQGSAHVTEDIDYCYKRTPENIARLVTALEPIHPYMRGAPPGLPFRLDAATIQAGLNFTLTTDLGDVDLLGEVSGIGDFDRVLAQAEEKAMFGLTVRVLSIEGLIAAKRAAGRLKDRNHLLELEELRKLRDAGPQGA